MTKSVQFLLYLTPIHKAALQAEAARSGLSMNAVLEGMIEHHCLTPELERYLELRDAMAEMSGKKAA